MRPKVVVRWLWITVALIWSLGGINVFLFHLSHDPLNDFHVYYDAAARLNAGLPLYPPGGRIYPPLFSILCRPLALLPFEIAAAIWEGLIVAALGATLWRIGIRRPATWWAVMGLSIGIGWTLAIGQAEAFIVLLLTIGSPFTVALAGNIKLYPLAAGIYWLARRDWHALGRLAGWTAGLALLQLILDPADTLAFPGTLGPGQVAFELASSGNLSPFTISPLIWAILVAIEVVVAFRLGRTRWGWAAAVVLSVFVSPRVFSYNLMTLLACLGGPDRMHPDREAAPGSAPAGREAP